MAMQSRFRDPFASPSACVSYHPGCSQQDFLVAPFLPQVSTSYHQLPLGKSFQQKPAFLIRKTKYFIYPSFQVGSPRISVPISPRILPLSLLSLCGIDSLPLYQRRNILCGCISLGINYRVGRPSKGLDLLRPPIGNGSPPHRFDVVWTGYIEHEES